MCHSCDFATPLGPDLHVKNAAARTYAHAGRSCLRGAAVPVMAIHVWVGRHPNTSRYNDTASSPDERRRIRFYPTPAWRQRAPRYPGVHPHIASSRAFGGLAGSCGLREPHWELLDGRGRLLPLDKKERLAAPFAPGIGTDAGKPSFNQQASPSLQAARGET
jgi:hypothetical protein